MAAFLLVLLSVRPLPGQAPPRALTADSLRVVFWPGYREQATRVLAAIRHPPRLPGLPARAGFSAGIVYLAPSPAVFDSLTGGRAPSWSAGVAIPDQGVIIVPAYATPHTGTDDPAITLRHELAHLALNAYLPGRVPRWFDEGYATWASGGWDQSSAWRLRLALLLGRAPPLDSLALEWPRGAERARLAYLLSATAVSYLAEQGGDRGLAALLSAWRTQGTLDAALRSTFGLTLGQFEQEWRRAVRRRYGWLLAFSQVTVFWALVTVLLLVFGTRRRRHNRRRLEAMRAEERMLPPPPEGVDQNYWDA